MRAIDVLPLIGQASREYKPIKRKEPLDPSAIENDWSVSHEPVKNLHTFTPKTDSDKKGCKPTGIALTRDDNIVLVDDINRKIEICVEAWSCHRLQKITKMKSGSILIECTRQQQSRNYL